MSGSWWVITPSWLSGLWRSFLYSSSLFYYHLFLIASASVRSIPFLSFIVHIFVWHVPLVSLIFFQRSLVFPLVLFSSICLHWSLRKAFLSLLAILWNSVVKWVYLYFSPLPLASLLFSAINKASSANHFAFLHLFFLGMVLIPVSCTSWTSIHSSSGALSGLIPWVCLSLPLYNHKGFDLGLSEWSSGFPYFLKFNCQFANKEFMIQGTVSSQSCFGWLYRASPSLAAKNTSSLISVLTIWWCPCVESSLVFLEDGLLWPVHSLGKTLLAFALVHFVLQGKTCLLLQVSLLEFLLLHSNPL